MEQTKPISNEAVMEIPLASPYYDRLRSLNIQLDFAPYGSPEYHFLNRQIEEMQQRAIRHAQNARRVNISTENL